jgi:NADP-dependent 3-hydroxy acid dehydrogenase YdfG
MQQQSKNLKYRIMENNIKGKVVVITGASSGLGEAAARHLSNLVQRLYSAQEELTGLKSRQRKSRKKVEKHSPLL